MPLHPLHLLLVDDDAIETMKFERALVKLNLNHKLTCLKNGAQALDYLEATSQPPDVILLDLHMPIINGIEFLEATTKHPAIRCIPKVILSTSNSEKEKESCYFRGAAGYIVKPLKYEDYVQTIARILNYWSINEIVN
jgi:CheY-like chemotaxis protein